MVTVTVPATSANVGAGFDSLGLAVSMHNVFTFEESDRIQISSVDGTHVPAGSNNLVYRSARVVYDQLGIPLKGLRITQRNDIPMARGLGSSSACIVAGIMGANALLGDKRSAEIDTWYSLQNRVSSETPPTLLLLSDDDRVVPPVNSTLYYNALKDNGVKASMHIYPTGGHGWGIRKNFKYREQWQQTVLDWLQGIDK